MAANNKNTKQTGGQHSTDLGGKSVTDLMSALDSQDEDADEE